MSSTLQEPQPPMQEPVDSINSNLAENEFAYRTFSKAAIASIVFAVLGALTSFLAIQMVLLPMMAAVFGVVALLSFRRYPDELSGKRLAQIGLIAGIVLFSTSLSYHVYIYNTEVPEGYQRISFGELRYNKRSTLPFNEKAQVFDGQKVFLKGYVRPSTKRRKLTDFILVGDFGDCCFGGNPDPTEVVAIRIKIDQTVDHSYALRKIGGTFRLNEDSRITGDNEVPKVFYEIDADYIR